MEFADVLYISFFILILPKFQFKYFIIVEFYFIKITNKNNKQKLKINN